MKILTLRISDDVSGGSAEKKWDLDKIKALKDAGAAFLPEVRKLESELNQAINQREAQAGVQAAEVAPAEPVKRGPGRPPQRKD